ncbi:unnamed protein product [Cyprideis torosa]|uniref:Uncharacterized protein n=1 Tax=Cyprideis torosa TaxID=163714 RepID=A0A7R8WDN6_9CRUS|nr:unnamed protein product [Cyprideis torosa]CAG0889287.1 unnamed protein product [Cyprideis torosa]
MLLRTSSRTASKLLFSSPIKSKAHSPRCGCGRIMQWEKNYLVPRIWFSTSQTDFEFNGAHDFVFNSSPTPEAMEFIMDIERRHRTVIPSETHDDLLESIKSALSINEVLNLLEEKKNETPCPLTSSHLIQAFISIWDLQKIIFYCPSLLSSAELIARKQQLWHLVASHPTFLWLVQSLLENINELSDDALSCLALFLPRMCASNDAERLVEEAMKNLTSRIYSLPLECLSRMVSALNQHAFKELDGLRSDLLRATELHVSEAKTADQFKNLVISYMNIPELPIDVVERLTIRIEEVFDETNHFQGEPANSLIKICTFLSHSRWLHKTEGIVEQLLDHVLNHLDDLDPLALNQIPTIYYFVQAPVSYVHKYVTHMARRLTSDQPWSMTLALSVVLPYVRKEVMRKRLLPLTESFCSEYKIKDVTYPEIVLLGRIVSWMDGISEKSLDRVLDRAADVFQGSLVEEGKCRPKSSLMLQWMETERRRLCKDMIRVYMHPGIFHRRGTGPGRQKWDALLFTKGQQQLLESMEETDSHHRTETWMNEEWSLLLAFRIASNEVAFPGPVLNRILHGISTYNDGAVLSLSQGLEQRMMSHKRHSPQFHRQLLQISRALNERTKVLVSSSPSLRSLIQLGQGVRCRRQLSGTDLFSGILNEMHRHFPDQLTSKAVYELCLILLGFRIRDDVLLEDMKFTRASRIVRSVLWLALTQNLGEELIRTLFSVKFLESVDAELKDIVNSFWSLRKIKIQTDEIREAMCLLNRVVCLEYPEAQVPWFHKQYCETKREQDVLPKNVPHSFRDSVDHTLSTCVGGAHFLERCPDLPYGLSVEYLCYLDKQGKFWDTVSVDESVVNTANLNRLAIRLLPSRNSDRELQWRTDGTSDEGNLQLERRHLEILGFHVLDIPLGLWSSLALSEECAKREWLNQQLRMSTKEKKATML